jgi:hypothetical protein
VTPIDERGNPGVITSAELRIQNTAPVSDQVTLSHSAPTESDVLVPSPVGHDVDQDALTERIGNINPLLHLACQPLALGSS